MRPDRFIGVFNAVVPYVASAFDFVPTEKLVEIAPGFGYQLYLSNNASGGAAEMDADPRSAIRSCAQVADTKVPEKFLKDTTSFLDAWREDNKKNNRTEIPFSGIMSKKVEDYMVETYKKQGFYNSKQHHPNTAFRAYVNNLPSLQRIPAPQPLRYLAV